MTDPEINSENWVWPPNPEKNNGRYDNLRKCLFSQIALSTSSLKKNRFVQGNLATELSLEALSFDS